jgi:1,4-alpha-glucan branching enzyme
LDKQAHHFIHNVENTVNYYKNMTGKFGTLSAPFDTELFGHWWFEGPMFIKYLIEGLNKSPWINMAKASEQYDLLKPQEVVGISEGSWGVNNSHEVWSNEETKWTWEAIYKDERRLEIFFDNNPVKDLNKTQERLMKQALREMMLMQASDWQFLIYTWSARDYAEQRFLYHHSDFNRILDLAENTTGKKRLKKEDKLYLEETEKRNSCFQEIELEWWVDLH